MVKRPGDSAFPAIAVGLAALLLGFGGGWLGSAVNQQDHSQSVIGPPGATGDPGQPGSEGSDGADGFDGADGSPGVAGPQGASGAPGAKGAEGDPGGLGPSGHPGPTGPPGPSGAPGDPGADGADATSLISGADFQGLMAVSTTGTSVLLTEQKTSADVVWNAGGAEILTTGYYRVAFSLTAVATFDLVEDVPRAYVLVSGSSFPITNAGTFHSSTNPTLGLSGWALQSLDAGDTVELEVGGFSFLPTGYVLAFMTIERIG